MPFDVKDGKVREVEQGSMDDVAGCVEVILRTPLGQRSELPEFGTQDPSFTAPPDIDRLRRSTSEWEPRAEVTIDEITQEDAFEVGLKRVRMTVGTRGGR